MLKKAIVGILRHKFFSGGTFEYHRVIHGIKTAIACLVGLAIFKFFNLPSGQWIPITVVVVMSAQVNFGGALQKAYMRFLGTVSGVGITILTLLLFDHNMAVIFVVVFCASVFFAYIASSSGNISYAGVLGGTTLLLTLTSADSNIDYALERGLYIAVGIAIALLVSRFVFPIHAREKLRFNVAATLRSLRQLYFKSIQTTLDETMQGLDSKLDKVITNNFTLQPQLIEEAAVGSRYFSLHKKKLFASLVGVERRVYRLIYFMHKDLYEDQSIAQIVSKMHGIENFHIVVENNLDRLAGSLEDFSLPQVTTDFAAVFATIEEDTASLSKEQNAQMLLDEHSFLFFMEQLVKELETMGELVHKINMVINDSAHKEE